MARRAGKGRRAARSRRASGRKRARVLRPLLLSALAGLALLATALLAASRYPQAGRLRTRNPEMTAMMRYRVEEARRKGEAEPRIVQFWAPLDRISPHLVRAIIAAEDDRFFQHRGFDFVEMQRALELNLKLGVPARGASTITQQLAKNLYLSPRKTITRKAEEAAVTVSLERRLSKERILELYLNVIELGSGIFGVEAASRRYFRKPASDLAPHEAVLLATAVPLPLKRDPSCPSASHVKRALHLLYRLKQAGDLSAQEFREARARLAGVACAQERRK